MAAYLATISTQDLCSNVFVFVWHFCLHNLLISHLPNVVHVYHRLTTNRTSIMPAKLKRQIINVKADKAIRKLSPTLSLSSISVPDLEKIFLKKK